MKAVILAAGIGSRLKNLTIDKPKCMLSIFSEKTLIRYQIEKLTKFGIKEDDIFIIAGYKIKTLRKHLSDINVNIIFNPKFEDWNNIYSFYLIKEIDKIKNEDNFVLLNSDTLFHEEILSFLLDYPMYNCIVLDTYKKMGKEEMKVIVKNSKVVKFGKNLPIYKVRGEYIGLAKFKKANLTPLFSAMEKLIREGKTNIWYEIAFNYVLPDKLDLEYVDTKNKPWIEIDTLEDYKKAKSLGKKL